MHLAHKKIIDFMSVLKYQNNLDPIIYTFKNHPSTVFSKNPVKLLSTNNERKIIFEKSKINNIIFQNFDKEFASLSAEEFIKDYLIKKLNMKFLVVGDDHKFGKGRQGDFESLTKLSEKYNFGIHKIDSVFLENTRISSTNIRHAIEQGNVEIANKMLGYDYFFISKVIGGDKIGRKIGFPTANLEYNPIKLLPQNGVYAVNVKIDDKLYNGMCNVGYRPTLNRSETVTVEVNIFDFNRNIYNQEIKISFVKKIRDELFFQSKSELVNQINIDKQNILEIFQNNYFYKKAVNN